MIDVHVLTHDGTRSEWLEQCLASLAGEPVTVHVIDNAGRSVGEGRARGYARGCAELVAFVDSDDYLLPGAGAACIEAIKGREAVCTQEIIEYEDGRVFPFARGGHAWTVYRRAAVAPYLDRLACAKHTADSLLRAALRPLQIDFVGYVWRVHLGGNHHNISQDIFNKEGRLWHTKTALQR